MAFEMFKKHLSQVPLEVILERSVESILAKIDLHGFNGTAFGASGGIDSLVSASICLKAREKRGNWRVMGLMMNDARVIGEFYNAEVFRALGVDLLPIDITGQAVEVERQLGMPPRWMAEWLMKLVLRWVPSRLRRHAILTVKSGAAPKWVLLNYQLLTLLHRLRIEMLREYALRHGLMRIVCANRTENLLGYFVEEGVDDPVMGDYAPILELYKSQVRSMAQYLGLPRRVIHQRPSPGLGGIYDEEIIGPYELVDLVLAGLELGYSDFKIKKALEPQAIILRHEKTGRAGGPFDIDYVRFLRKLKELNSQKGQ